MSEKGVIPTGNISLRGKMKLVLAIGKEHTIKE
jgi:hypothetical protein